MFLKPKNPKAPATHPPYIDMVSAALIALEDPKGTSRQALLRDYIQCSRDIHFSYMVFQNSSLGQLNTCTVQDVPAASSP